jgi:hypothetical protein
MRRFGVKLRMGFPESGGKRRVVAGGNLLGTLALAPSAPLALLPKRGKTNIAILFPRWGRRMRSIRSGRVLSP